MRCVITPRRGWLPLYCIFAFIVVFIVVFIRDLHAQDLSNIQIHGFATQGFLFSTNNNYLAADTSSGSLQWTHGAISVIDAPSDNLRIGIQLQMYQLGELGGPNIQVDWASGDYRVNDHFGVRAGKVKTVVGLYNDSQDVDSIFLWCLLPQGTYSADNESFFLSHLGVDVYGQFSLGDHRRKIKYTGYVGHVNLDLTGGFIKELSDEGLVFNYAPGGKVYGGDLRWLSFVHGLTVGSSITFEALDGTAPEVTLHIPTYHSEAQYAQFDRGKWSFSGQYSHIPSTQFITTPLGKIAQPYDIRSWYAMASYRISEKVQVGSYYSHFINRALDTSLPQNYSKDFVISARYDFNNYFYAKIEDHFLHGTELGYYTSDNPNGLQPNSNILAAKIGFSF
jgi:hypothetical protein